MTDTTQPTAAGPTGQGSLWVVGVGPGDPELITVKAARLIGSAPVVAYHHAAGKPSNARTIATTYVAEGAVEEALEYPVTTGETSHEGGYYGAMDQFYDECARRLGDHLRGGRDVVLLAEGDPLFYGSSMYVRDLLSAAGFVTAVVPGVTSMAGATASLGTGLCRHEDVLTVLPGTLPVPELARRLADTDAAVIMKLGRTFPGVVEALRQAGRLDDAWYVERATRGEAERRMPVRDVDPAGVPYMAIVIVPGRDVRADNAGRASGAGNVVGGAGMASPVAGAGAVGTDVTAPAELLVIGLGPGPDRWLTPEAREALAGVGHVVGYAPYVDRVPQREGLQRHSSGNTVEVDRARFALDLALKGERVAVVSGGDAGVFGMASAVFEAAEGVADDGTPYSSVPVRVLPGLTAAQAVAANAGAPMGGDFAIMSLSDRLKPWPVVEERLRLVSRADLVLSLYNPASRTRTEQIYRAVEVLREERGDDAVVIIGRDVGRAEESMTVTTLGELDPGVIDMKCLVMIGARGTSVDAAGRVWTKRFVPAE